MSGIKDRILAADDLPVEDVEVPEWGVTVQVRGMSGTDRDAYEAKAVALKRGGTDIELRLADFRSKLLVKSLFDPESGERIFADNEVHKLGAKSGQVIERLFEVAGRLSGMADKSTEVAKGNSVTARSGGSTSG
jgi:hypothetical protein